MKFLLTLFIAILVFPSSTQALSCDRPLSANELLERNFDSDTVGLNYYLLVQDGKIIDGFLVRPKTSPVADLNLPTGYPGPWECSFPPLYTYVEALKDFEKVRLEKVLTSDNGVVHFKAVKYEGPEDKYFSGGFYTTYSDRLISDLYDPSSLSTLQASKEKESKKLFVSTGATIILTEFTSSFFLNPFLFLFIPILLIFLYTHFSKNPKRLYYLPLIIFGIILTIVELNIVPSYNHLLIPINLIGLALIGPFMGYKAIKRFRINQRIKKEYLASVTRNL